MSLSAAVAQPHGQQKSPPERNHACTWPGCRKTFTRAEHLRRHALNHRQGDNSCDRCGVHFNRPDLLGRHIARHAKRDEEAGGPGLGVLETRKRTRRGPDGTLITRPTKKQARAMAAKEATASRPAPSRTMTGTAAISPNAPSASSVGSPKRSGFGAQSQGSAASLTTPPSTNDLGYHDRDAALSGAPASPPRSSAESCASRNLENGQFDTDQAVEAPDPLIAPMVPGGPYEPYVEPIPGQFDAADGSWQNHSEGVDLGYSAFVDFDTATSFNMPFAATHNYNWLFDVQALDDAFGNFDAPLVGDLINFAEPLPELQSQSSYQLGGRPSALYGGTGRTPDVDSLNGAHIDTLTASTSISVPPGGGIPSPNTQEAALSTPSVSSTSFSPNSCRNAQATTYFPDVHWASHNKREPTKSSNGLPKLGEVARTGVLMLLSELQPLTVGGNSIDASSPLLCPESLQKFCDLFFTKFNTSYPLVHQATFDPDRVDTLFLVAVLCMGATYSTNDAHQLAVEIHNRLRNHLFSHLEFSTNPDLWVLQTVVLIDCFGKHRAGHKQREMAQLFHCVLIKLIRRSNCLIIRSNPAVQRPDDLELAWKQAMDAEARKRLAMLCFIWDTQHAVLFSQSLCMSAFEIRSSLPCDPPVWEASTAEEWFECSQREQSHGLFLSVLKAYVTPITTRRPRHLNPLARIFLLHGLMSISSDLKRRDQTTLRSETPNLVGAWKSRVSRSYDLWKTDFDADCMNMKLNQLSDPRRFTGLKIAAHVMYHTAQLTLDVEILDLQVYAGAPHILGRVVTEHDFKRSERVVTRWRKEDPRSAAKAARHAAFVLQDAIMNMHDWDETEVFHYPWCLYLATLTCWAFHLPTSAMNSDSSTAETPTADQDGGNGVSPGDRRSIVSNPAPATRNDMTTLVTGMTTCSSHEELSALAGKFDTAGLTATMARQLAGVRWTVVQDAMTVLIGLKS